LNINIQDVYLLEEQKGRICTYMRKQGQNTKFLKDCIAQALLELMKEKDYSDITVLEICKKAGVGRTTFYRHFSQAGNKDDILVYYAGSLWNDYLHNTKIEDNKEIWTIMIEFIYNQKDFFSSLKNAQLDHTLFMIFYQGFKPEINDSQEIIFFKSFLSGAFFGITYNWVKNGFIEHPTEIAKNSAELLREHALKNEFTYGYIKNADI